MSSIQSESERVLIESFKPHTLRGRPPNAVCDFFEKTYEDELELLMSIPMHDLENFHITPDA